MTPAFDSIPERIAASFPELKAILDAEVTFYAPDSVPVTVFVADEFLPFMINQLPNSAARIRCLAFLEELAASKDEATLDLLATSIAEPLLAKRHELNALIAAAGPHLNEVLIRVRDWPSP